MEKISLILPPELWDLILGFLPVIKLVETTLLSKFFEELINLNRGLRCIILLYKNRMENYLTPSNIHRILDWTVLSGRLGYIEESSKVRLEVLKWLYSTSRITEKNIKCRHNYIFAYAARNGDLNMLKWLSITFNFTDEDARSFDNSALHYAALNGHLEVLKWLHSTFNLTKKDIRSDNNHAFRWAAKSGHLEVLKWLHLTFNLTGKDARSDDNCAFWWAAHNGYLEVLQWLYSTFNFTKVDAMSCSNSAFVLAASNGHLKILQWLHSTFDFKQKGGKDGCCRAFWWAAYYCYSLRYGKLSETRLEVLKWLYFTFQMNEEEIKGIMSVGVSHDQEILQSLKSTF